MQECKIFLQNLLKTKFNKFYKTEEALRSIFNIYFMHIQILQINENGIIKIGVKIPHLLCHFNNLKKNILQQLKESCCNIEDIIFVYYNKKNSFPISNIEKFKIKEENKITEEKKNEIYNIIIAKCPKKEFHDLLYNIYLKVVNK